MATTNTTQLHTAANACQDCGAGTHAPCADDCASARALALALHPSLYADGCDCWSTDCGHCGQQLRQGKRPTVAALRRAARAYA